MNQEEINREANIESRKFYGEESWDSSTWATTPFEFGYRLAREKAQEEIDNCKAYYSKDNKIGPIAQLEYAIEKRDRFLDEAREIMEARLDKINLLPEKSYEKMMHSSAADILSKWLNRYEEIFKDAK